jgi:hypothetical protein
VPELRFALDEVAAYLNEVIIGLDVSRIRGELFQ